MNLAWLSLFCILTKCMISCVVCVLPPLCILSQHVMWVGAYECSQGFSSMALRIVEISDATNPNCTFSGVFNFSVPSNGCTGSYAVGGSASTALDGSISIKVLPSVWIDNPCSYRSASVTAAVSEATFSDGPYRVMFGTVSGPPQCAMLTATSRVCTKM